MGDAVVAALVSVRAARVAAARGELRVAAMAAVATEGVARAVVRGVVQ